MLGQGGDVDGSGGDVSVSGLKMGESSIVLVG